VKNLFSLVVLAFAFVGCRRTDVRDFVVSIPSMTAADQATIAASLAPYAGVDKQSLVFDFEKHELRLSYDSMQLAKKNVEMAIAAAGFAANGVTPESVGAQPKAK